jgi:hypothetical protein
VANHEGHTICDQFIGNSPGLQRITGIIANNQFQAFSKHPASGVYIGYGLLGATLKLLSRPGPWTCYRPGKSNQDFSPWLPGKYQEPNKQV